ncbi:MAG: adenylyltransferase/cytidyltransferase family protein [Planctomycetota bacterium]
MLVREEEAASRVAAARERGLRVGFTCGVFDLVHAGHADYLRAARRRCDLLVVAVNDDASVARLKGEGRPIVPFAERAEVVDAFRAVDLVLALPDDRPTRLIRLLRPDLYVKGGDYDLSRLGSAPEVEGYGGEVLVIPVRHDRSSRHILRRLEELEAGGGEGGG